MKNQKQIQICSQSGDLHLSALQKTLGLCRLLHLSVKVKHSFHHIHCISFHRPTKDDIWAYNASSVSSLSPIIGDFPP